MKYKFTVIDRVLDFVKSLILEGKHKVSIRTFYKNFPREYMIDYFEVTVEEVEENETHNTW